MPLPPLLAERLKKRRILRPEDAAAIEQQQQQQLAPPLPEPRAEAPDERELSMPGTSTDRDDRNDQASERGQPEEPEEEIIAQDYSDSDSAESDADDDEYHKERRHESGDRDQHSDSSDDSSSESGDSDADDAARDSAVAQNSAQNRHESHTAIDLNQSLGPRSYLKCPNKYNVYHTCTHYCRQMYSSRPDVPTTEQKSQLMTLLSRYPLLPDWRPVYDPGVCTFYFWNTQTDQVSWLPISHPGAIVSLSANKMREMAYSTAPMDPSIDV